MVGVLGSGVQHQRPPLPAPAYDPKKADPSVIKRWLDFGIAYENGYYLRRCSLWNLADLYDQGVQTWLERTYNVSPDIAPYWAYMTFKKEDRVPTPVLNEFSAPIDNEASRIARPRYKPHVRPTGENPGIKEREGAKLGEKVIKHELVRMRWEEEYDRGHRHMPLYGGWIVDSFWDQSWEDTVRLPVKGAMRCPQCGFTLATPKVTIDMVMDHEGPLFSDRIGVEGSETLEVTDCLMCQPPGPAGPASGDDLGMERVPPPAPPWAPPKLQPFTAVGNERYATDAFGRPLGEDWPAGNWQLATRDPRGVWFENMGIGVVPSDIREWWQVEVVSLDHVRNRYADGEQVKAEAGEAIMMYHPIGGQPDIYFDERGGSLFSNHVRIRRYCRRPFREWRKIEGHPDGGRLEMNRGRLIEAACGQGGQDVVLFDGDLLMESANNPGVYVERREIDYVPFGLRSGGNEMLGTSMAEGLFDACDGGNEIWSQLAQCRRAKGLPKWLIERSLNFEYRPGGKAASIVNWDMNPLAPSLAPREIDNDLMNSAVYQEMDARLGYISRYSAQTETERGEPPPGVTAQIAFAYLVDQSSTRRQPRMQRIRAMLQRRYTHGLRLIHEMVPPEEQRVLWDDESGDWTQRVWTGLQLAGQTDVIVEVEPDSDSALIEQQAVRDFAELRSRLQDLDIRTQRIIARKMRVPEELFETQDTQTERAEREYVEFLERGKPAVVDPTLDDHALHDEQHGLDCFSEKWLDAEERAAWDQALLYISDWKLHFEQGTPKLYELLAPAGIKMPPPTMGENGEQIPPTLQSLDEMLPAQIPPALEIRILEAWKLLLRLRRPDLIGPQPMGPDETPESLKARETEQHQALARVMRWRAHREAHRIYGEGQKQAAAAGQQVLAAPGGEETPGGTVPTADQPPAEAAMEGTP